jgi:small-conductance mechanosensitive channel
MDSIIIFLNKPTFKIYGQTLTIGDWLVVPLVLIVGFLLMRWLVSFITKQLVTNDVDINMIQLIRRLLYVVATIILVITTLDLINIPLTAFAFISGAVAIGVGFGAQNIINNFISGWILMWERPIGIGDFLEIDANKGTVEAINTRSTRIRRVDGVHMLIPNSKLLENTVVNWNLIDKLIRTNVRIGIAYGSPVKLASQLILQAVVEQNELLTNPKPIVIFDDFGDNALMFDTFFWVEAIAERDLRIIRSNIRFRIYDLFEQNNIVIAFPQRDIHIDGELKLNR